MNLGVHYGWGGGCDACCLEYFSVLGIHWLFLVGVRCLDGVTEWVSEMEEITAVDGIHLDYINRFC